ncbi:MAG: cis-prenyltransferase [Claussenomyces sp. TS43310]|nr:MAG: cis-prenyltransferase [Claussenomyces sp. TS43310]
MSSLHLAHVRRWFWTLPPVEWGINHLRELLIGALKQGSIPRHVAFVMDGNRRFARSHDIEVVEGHNLGFEALARIIEVCYKSGVKVVTVYAFSIENFKRSKYEVDALMEMFRVKLAQIAQHGDLLDRYGASIRIIGQRELVRKDVLEAIDKAVETTSGNKDAILNVCFPYTSRDEITSAIKSTVEDFSKPLPPQARPFSQTRITQKIRSKTLATSTSSSRQTDSPTPATLSDAEDSVSSSTTLHPDSPPNDIQDDQHTALYPDPEAITATTIDDHLFTADLPPLDLLIRTSGVNRLSDFMLWQCHQNTEIVFLDCFWPAFDLWQFLPVLVEWQWRRKYSEDREVLTKAKAGKLKTR